MSRNCSAPASQTSRMAEYSDRRAAKSKGSPQLRGESHADVVRARYRMWNQVTEGQKIDRAKQIALGIIATTDTAITKDHLPPI